MPLEEFSLIDRFFKPSSRRGNGIVVDIGDDAAVLQAPPGLAMVSALSCQNSAEPRLKAVDATNFAVQLVAEGKRQLLTQKAQPVWATLALCLPEIDASWLDSFSTRLLKDCEECGLQLVGGDTTSGPLNAVLAVHGLVPENDNGTGRNH